MADFEARLHVLKIVENQQNFCFGVFGPAILTRKAQGSMTFPKSEPP